MDQLESKVSLKGLLGKIQDGGLSSSPSVPTNGQTSNHEALAADSYTPDPDVELKLTRALELLNSYSVLTHQVVTENEALAEENARLQRTANSLAVQRNVVIGGAVLIVVAAIFRCGVFR